MSLVIPVYRNEESVPELLRSVEALHAALKGAFEAVFVVDGSPDRSGPLLADALSVSKVPAQLVFLSRNFGSFSAIRAGLKAGRGDAFAVMAADLQEPPELILDFWERLESGEYDVVVGVREHRADPWAGRLASSLFWWIYRKLVLPETPPGGVDVFACTKAFRDHLVSLPERNSTLIGLIFWMGFRRGFVRYARRERSHGRSGWSFKKRFRYLLDSIFAFSDLPLRILWITGLLGVGLSLLLGAIVLIAKSSGRISVPGYSATVLVVMFFGGLNSMGIGLLGEYVWRAFENTKARPPFLVAERLTFGPPLFPDEGISTKAVEETR